MRVRVRVSDAMIRVGGMKMVTRKKFSARSFWNDCLSEGVTVR